MSQPHLISADGAPAGARPPASGPDSGFRLMAELMPQLVWSTTPDGYHDWFNARWYAYTGMPRPEAPGGEHEVPQGWSWKDYLHADDVARAQAAWSHALATGSPYEVEYRFREAATGAYRWFIGRAMPMRDADGRIVRWFGTCTDIDDAKQGELALGVLADAGVAIAAALDAEAAPAPRPLARLRALPRPALAAAAVATLAVNALAIAWSTGRFSAERPGEVDPGRFRTVRIADMSANTEPHVVAEGIVSEVRVDPRDGDVKFRIVESLYAPEPFVVCEVIGPYRIDPPRVGSRVRVFGVSRFDSKEAHRWHEIHPVLKVELLDNKTALATSPDRP